MRVDIHAYFRGLYASVTDSERDRMKANIANRAAHFLGIANQDNLLGLKGERSTDNRSGDWFQSILTDYIQTLSSDSEKDPYRGLLWASKKAGRYISGRLKHEVRHHKLDLAQVEAEISPLFNDYHVHQQPVFLPIGPSGHAVTVIIWGKQLIVSNRGSGSQGMPGTTLYNLQSPLSKRQLAELVHTPLQTKDPFLFNLLIDRLVGDNEPVARFTLKSQDKKTCGLSNKKAIIGAFHCLFEQNQTRDTVWEDISSISTTRRQAAIEKQKRFTSWVRNNEIEEMLYTVEHSRSRLCASLNAAHLAFYINTRARKWGRSSTAKASADKRRALYILQTMESIRGGELNNLFMSCLTREARCFCVRLKQNQEPELGAATKRTLENSRQALMQLLSKPLARNTYPVSRTNRLACQSESNDSDYHNRMRNKIRQVLASN